MASQVARASKAAQTEKAIYSSMPKKLLYVRIGFEHDQANIKQLPRYRLDKETIDRVFGCKVHFLQEAKSGNIVLPEQWKEECLPAPSLYFIREELQPVIEPDMLEDETYRGSVGVYCINVPDEVDAGGVQAWISAGLDDDDPELVASKLRLEEVQTRLKEIIQQIAQIPMTTIAGTTVQDEVQIKSERVDKLLIKKGEMEAHEEMLRQHIESLVRFRDGADGRGFSVRLCETVLPMRLNTWEIMLDDDDRGSRLAYIATHKLNWHHFLLGVPKSGFGKAQAHKAPWGGMDKRLKLVSMRSVKVVRLQHGRGMLRFRDERGFYSGQWCRGKRHGVGCEINSLGRFSGHFVREWKNGVGTQVFANGDVYQGEYKSVANHEQMSLLSGDEYMDGVCSGEGRFRFVDGAEYVGEFSQGRPCGEGKYIDGSGSTFKGTFGKNVLLQGSGMSIVGDLLQTGTWKHGQLHGRAVTIDRALGKHMGGFRHGLPHGFGTMDATAVDMFFRGNYLYGFRHGRGVLDSGNVHRDKQAREAHQAKLREAAKGKTGAHKAAALDNTRLDGPGVSAALMAARADGAIEGPSGDEVSGSVQAAIEAALTGLGAETDADAELRRRGDGKKKKKNEYEKFKPTVNIEYRGDAMYEGKWRASRQRIEGLCTSRLGRPEPHFHRRWYSSNLQQERLKHVTDLLMLEESTHLARRRAITATSKEVLTHRLEKEADNLKSFAYWQGKARDQFEEYKRKTTETKGVLNRVKEQLARPDDLTKSATESTTVAPAAYGLTAVKMDEENIRFYKEAIDGVEDDSAEFGIADGREPKLARDDADFHESAGVRNLSVLSDV
jgi:hypothetical protein